MSVHIFGVRHHGPGSARSVRLALEALQPDMVLVEGPPEAADALPLLTHPQMQPPVALLVYVPDQPQRVVYYPFAVFSPEWQALTFALTHNLAVRFMDLPQSHWLALSPTADGQPPASDQPPSDPQPSAPQSEGSNLESEIPADPLRWLAETAGYSDSERWWEHMVEQRRDSLKATGSAELFEAILEAMTALREEVKLLRTPESSPLEAQREAYMRQTIRAAQREGFQRIAVVCGAWHAPALADMPPAKQDAAVLKGLPKVKVQVTWVPWTYGRLSWTSGYGAGIESPGWYHHLWTTGEAGLDPTGVAIGWMTRVAHLFREEDLDASSAHIIEAVRLAESLAALRGRPLPGLPELNETTRAIFCFDSDLPMRLIHDRLIVSEMMGRVPDETPMVPLQQDLLREQKRLRLPAEATQRTLDLDLRKPNDLERSHLLHRLAILGIPWGQAARATGKGTFHELWRVQWQPEFAIRVIEAGMWGNTVEAAAASRACDAADHAPDLPALTNLLNRALLADLPAAISHLMARLQAEAALASDVARLMEALPPLADVLRYGSVRQTDAGMVGQVVDGLVARICIGLPVACASLNDEAAAGMFDRLVSVHNAVTLLQKQDHLEMWHTTLAHMADQQGLHGLLAGRCCRLLLDAGALTPDAAARRMSLALSAANDPAQAAAWVEGFLKGSGLLLLHSQALWQVLDNWVVALPGETFTALLPLLRRTFATFPAPERRQMGERAKLGLVRPTTQAANVDFDVTRAEATLALVAQLLGIREDKQ